MPHVGLGLFVEEQDTHDLLELRPRAFDRARFDEALQEAEALGLDYAGRIDSVHIFGLDEDLTHVTRLEEIPLGCVPAGPLDQGFEHEHRDLPVRLGLVLRVVGPHFDRTFPPDGFLVADDLSRCVVELGRAILQLDMRIAS